MGVAGGSSSRAAAPCTGMSYSSSSPKKNRCAQLGLQKVRPRPDVGVWNNHGLSLVPVDAVEVGDRPAGGLPVPETADGDADEAFLVRLEGLLLALGDQERHGRIRERRLGARRDVEPGRRPAALVVADHVALPVADRREELAPDELVRASPGAAVAGDLVREDKDVPDLVDEPGAQQPWQIAGCRRVEAGRADGRVVEPRPTEVLEGFRVEREAVSLDQEPGADLYRRQAARKLRRCLRWVLRWLGSARPHEASRPSRSGVLNGLTAAYL